jgi:hypothetical protein
MVSRPTSSKSEGEAELAILSPRGFPVQSNLVGHDVRSPCNLHDVALNELTVIDCSTTSAGPTSVAVLSS